MLSPVGDLQVGDRLRDGVGVLDLRVRILVRDRFDRGPVQLGLVQVGGGFGDLGSGEIEHGSNRSGADADGFNGNLSGVSNVRGGLRGAPRWSSISMT